MWVCILSVSTNQIWCWVWEPDISKSKSLLKWSTKTKSTFKKKKGGNLRESNILISASLLGRRLNSGSQCRHVYGMILTLVEGGVANSKHYGLVMTTLLFSKTICLYLRLCESFTPALTFLRSGLVSFTWGKEDTVKRYIQ